MPKENAYMEKIHAGLDGKADAVLVFAESESVSDKTFYYATQCLSGAFEGSAAVFGEGVEPAIVTSPLEEQAALQSGLPVKVFGRGSTFWEELKAALKGAKTIAVNKSGVSARLMEKLNSTFPKAKFVDAWPAISRARSVKTAEEIEKLAAAAEIASKAALELASLDYSTQSEAACAAELNYFMGRHGASSPSFPTIAAFGENSALPHHVPSSASRAKKGSFLLFDFGALFQRYCSDVTRTLVLGRASPKQVEIYETVARTQQAAFDEIRPGAKASSVHNAAQKVIDSSKFKGLLTHSVGHGLGVEVHDCFGVAPSSGFELEKGMVFTVEPGIYVPGFGGVRVEDDVLVTRNGFKRLSRPPGELIEV